ncbi:ExbD/TolR family protein [Polycyclovorans algicola]|uniref:ExbD/TolR family protein n=1 Tax=Polycyclovorans algicola TaxID=616992 RepID=UPI0004A70A44|nr:biopolymer transporter ExbD [Polycyclovorans algicola]
MLKRSGGKRAAEEANIDITPLLDIVFIMLIFFIVTSTFIKEPGIDVNRPEAETAEDQRLVSILVAVSSDNKIWINREEVQMDGVRAAIERLRRENPKGSAVLQVDGDAHSRYMVEVLQRIRDAGVDDVVAVSTKRS